VEERRLDHGVIGNGRVLAIIAPDTAIEWLCLPRVDSPSLFASLLDRERGGTFRCGSAAPGARSEMAYVANTNVLRTRVTASDGAFEVFDFAPRIPGATSVDAPVEICRLLVPRRGRPRVTVRFDPQPDYARVPPELIETAEGLELGVPGGRVYLRTSLPASAVREGAPFRLDEPQFLILSWETPSTLTSPAAVRAAMDATVAGWREWAQSCAVPSFAAADVLRSALCLKLLVFEDTGAIVAAATTSIPEAPGTARTWDYRYCWPRDAAFVVEAFRRLHRLSEGEAFVRFLRHIAVQGPLQPLYGVSGERNLIEHALDHLAGFAGGRPVRIGNDAYRHHQHDLMGEMVLCFDTMLADVRVIEDEAAVFDLVERLVEEAIAASALDDAGPWEFRARMAPYTFSRMLCWVAAHRGARIAGRLGRTAEGARWAEWADQQRAEILAAAYNEERGFFAQALHSGDADASLLLMPMLGFIDATDPRFVSTVRAYERILVKDGLMRRYRHQDDFGSTTSAFTICSFWWAEALAMMGELDEAVALFHRLVAHANPLGLLSEDIDPATGRLFGNFPQAYSHAGLIHAAVTIGGLLEARESRVHAWG